MADTPKRPKRPRDMNELAAAIVREATGEAEEERHIAAVQRGEKGGKKGGKARAEKLTPEQRSAIAKKAAAARWKPTNQE